MVIDEKLALLPLGYSVFERREGYNEDWDDTAELQLDSEVGSDDFLLVACTYVSCNFDM